MKIILSPAKKMKVDTDSIDTMSSPVFLEKTEEILGWMQGRTEEELKKLWKCNDKITTENIERIKTMNFQDRKSTRLNSSHKVQSRMPSSA